MQSPRRASACLAVSLGIATLGFAACTVGQPRLPPTAQDESAERLRALTGQPLLRPTQVASEGANVPETPVNVDRALASAIKHGTRTRNMVAITLDDGPSKDSRAVLDIIQREKAPVTFFYVGGRVISNTGAAKRAVRLGCELGDHTENHVELVGLTDAHVRSEIERCRDEIARVTGVAPVYVRPRAGMIDRRAQAVVRSEGMQLVLWDTDPGDTIPSPPASEIARSAISKTRPGSIILLHETNPATVRALPLIIRGLRRRGFRLVTLSTLLGRYKPSGRRPLL